MYLILVCFVGLFHIGNGTIGFLVPGSLDQHMCLLLVLLYIYIYNWFIVRFLIGLDFHFITFLLHGVIMKSIGAAFYDRMPFLT